VSAKVAGGFFGRVGLSARRGIVRNEKSGCLFEASECPAVGVGKEFSIRGRGCVIALLV